MNPTSALVRPIYKKRRSVMKMKWMTLAMIALALSPSLALASTSGKSASSNGTGHATQYHDRTPHIHERGSVASR